MSIRGDVPIPCFNSWSCKRAGGGKNWCNPFTKHCENRLDPYNIKSDPLGCCARKFRFPVQGTYGSRADIATEDGGQREDPITIDPLTWEQTVESMWYDLLHWGSIVVPGNESDPTFWQKFRYVFLDTQKRSVVTSSVIVIIALLTLVV